MRTNNIHKNPPIIYKSELARLLGISSRTLQRWLNEIEYDELKKRRYRKTQKFLTKSQLDYLFPTGIYDLLDKNLKKTAF